jgi:UDP-N-acetylmuramoyl-L-alanyl-D-glutamate--2,6-diaminopimelate ligase
MKKILARTKKVAEKIPGYDYIVLPWHRYQAFRAANKYDYPAANLKVIGVTGTNGKTTTCFMIHRMLTDAGFKTGLSTTVAYGVGNNIKPQTDHMTTVDAMLLNKRIREMADSGAEFLVLELTSHALSQYRAFGIPIDVAVETNVTHEHLDYHKTMKRYRDAKLKLFKIADNAVDGSRVGIINADDPSVHYFTAEIEKPMTYGVEKGEVRARQLKLNADGVDYFIKYDGRRLHIKTQIPGLFNVYNSLATAVVGMVYGLSNKQIERGIYALDYIEGRMNKINAGQDFKVLIDYAHTPDSFQQLFSDMRKNNNGKIIALFGSAGGRRDPSKRRPMGEIAGKYADILVLTEEDDRDTDGEKIQKQIAAGAKKFGKKLDKNLFMVPDRTEAIELALSKAKKGDLVLLLGKGNEKTIERADGEHPWNEAAITRRLLKKFVK